MQLTMKKAEAHIKCYRKTSWENTYEHFGCDRINQIHLALSVLQLYNDTRIPADFLIKLYYLSVCTCDNLRKIHWIFMILDITEIRKTVKPFQVSFKIIKF